MSKFSFVFLSFILGLAGCANYSWKPTVPSDMRTVAVPVFRNETNVPFLGNEVTRQILREIQRDGTFAVKSKDECAIEVQGLLKSLSSSTVAYHRSTGSRAREMKISAVAIVSVIDKKRGKVLVNNKKYERYVTTLADLDTATSIRNASERLSAELARVIVDDLTAYDFKHETEKQK
jgi:hypothetical protein